MAARITQVVNRAVRGGNSDARITQVINRAVRGGDPSARATQAIIRVIRGLTSYVPTMYTYLSSATPDYAETLSLDPQDVIGLTGEKGIIINSGYGVNEERLILSDQSLFMVTLQWKVMSEADHSTLFDWYHDENKADGIEHSFLWSPPSQYDSHVYVVRFNFNWESFLQNYKNYGVARCSLAVVGRYS